MSQEVFNKFTSTEFVTDAKEREGSRVSSEDMRAVSPNTIAILEKVYPFDKELGSVIEDDLPISHALRTFFGRVRNEEVIQEDGKRDFDNDSLCVSDIALLSNRWREHRFFPEFLRVIRTEDGLKDCITLVEAMMRIPGVHSGHKNFDEYKSKMKSLVRELDALCDREREDSKGTPPFHK